MSNEKEGVDCDRRVLLAAATCACGAAVGGTAALYPFAASWLPSERAKAAGAPVEADISTLKPGEMMTVEWRGKPVWIIRRTAEQLAALAKGHEQIADPGSSRSDQPEYCKNAHRSIKPEYMVAIGICTHLGCSPSPKFQTGAESGISQDWPGGFLCPCHGSTFDLAGRVFKNKPAPDNLPIPPHKYLADTRILIGEDSSGA